MSCDGARTFWALWKRGWRAQRRVEGQPRWKFKCWGGDFLDMVVVVVVVMNGLVVLMLLSVVELRYIGSSSLHYALHETWPPTATCLGELCLLARTRYLYNFSSQKIIKAIIIYYIYLYLKSFFKL